MRLSRTCVLVLLAFAIAGCTSSYSRGIPVTDPAKRLGFNGFSILPPRGEGWMIIPPPFVPRPGWKQEVMFVKEVVRNHTAYAAVFVGDARPLGIKDKSELLKRIAGDFIEESKREPPFRSLDAGFLLDKCSGHDCARYRLAVEDPRSGTPLLLTRRGIILPHPDSPTFIIWLETSERFPQGQQRFRIDTEFEPLLASVEIKPIR